MEFVFSAIVILLVVATALNYYASAYFDGPEFKKLLNDYRKIIDDINLMNLHIQELDRFEIIRPLVKRGEMMDFSSFKYSRKHHKTEIVGANVHNCSLDVCRRSVLEPNKYLQKYFGFKPNTDTLQKLEALQNTICALEEGVVLLNEKYHSTCNEIKNKLPYIILTLFKQDAYQKLGFKDVEIKKCSYPKFYFQYVSAGGNTNLVNEICFDPDFLDQFITQISEKIKFDNSIFGQRRLMTKKLRNQIKTRDNYTCQTCEISTNDEKNLLLEIDHIIPVSKGGLTSEQNLQTLCWRCNRTKGAKM